MELLLAAVVVLVGSGLIALALRRSPGPSSRVGALGVVAAAVLCAGPVLRVLAIAEPLADYSLDWSMPGGLFVVGLDVLSAWFLLLVLVVPPLAAVFGCEFLKAYAPQKSLGENWLAYNLVVAGMLVVTIARDGLLFLMAWEIMALASYFLVVFEHEREEVRQAGWTYLVASHLGTAFLFAMFILMGPDAGPLAFGDATRGPSPVATHLAGATPDRLSLLFVLAVIGFGTKAGFMPFHVWLPEAYPAAAGHTPAMLSGVMSKMGIYGLLRVIALITAVPTFQPPVWWGLLLIGLGILSGLGGILSAVGQRQLRRILAYSSIENMGIIGIGLGTGLLGLSARNVPITVLGFAGAVFHALNHSLFKGLLFLGAAAVEQSTGTGNINLMGGLLKRLPNLGIPFLVGCVAIAGLPPLNGFASEFLIYMTALREELLPSGVAAVAALSGIAALTLIGGFAAYCFTMVAAIAFLGEPRSAEAGAARPVGLLMQAPVWLLALGCFGVGMLAPRLMEVLAPIVHSVTHLDSAAVALHLVGGTGEGPVVARDLLRGIVTATGSLLAVALVLAFVRRQLLRGREVTESGTWGCGFYLPDASMQYTASSFAQPLVDLIAPLLRMRKHIVRPMGLFPNAALLWTESPDVGREKFYAPVFRAVASVILRLRWVQHGRLHLYVLYIAITIVLLLFWTFGKGAGS